MAIEIKEISDLLGVEITDATTIDDLKSNLREKWVSYELLPTDEKARAIGTGKALGSVATKIKKGWKEFGIEFEDGEIEDANNPESVYYTGLKKAQALLLEQQEKAKQGSGQKYETVLKDFEKIKAEKDQIEGLLNNVKTDFQKYQETVQQEKKSFRLNNKKADYEKEIKLSENVDRYKLRGFQSELADKYKLEWDDETEDIIVYDAQTNKRVENASRNGLAKWGEIYAKEADAAELVAKNTGRSDIGSAIINRPVQTNNTQTPARIAPSALAAQ